MAKLIGTTCEIPTISTAIPLDCLGSNLCVEKEHFVKLISALPANDCIVLCSKLNLLFSRAIRDELPNQQEVILKQLVDIDWIDISDFRRMKKYVTDRQESFEDNFFYTRISCIELIRWLSSYGCRTGVVQRNNIKRKQHFARAMLSAFEIWSERTQNRLIDSELPEGSDENRANFELLRAFREQSLWQNSRFHPEWQFGRAYELFLDLFLGRNEAIMAAVEQKLAMRVEDYIKCVVILFSYPKGWMNSRLPLTENFEFALRDLSEQVPLFASKLEKFLKLETIDESQLQQKYKRISHSLSELTDLRPIREHPIFLFNNQKSATFLDDEFLAERCSNGLLFKAANIVGEEAMQKFGVAFEEYAIRRLDRYVLALRKQGHEISGIPRPFAYCKKRSQKVELCDYVISCGSKLITIEIKGKWLQDRSVAGSTAEEYWSEIYDKYVLSKTETGVRKKGVSQLASSLTGLLDKSLTPEFAFDLQKFEALIPLLLVYDQHLPVLFHGTFLALELQRAMAINEPSLADGYIAFDHARVVNLCLVSMNDFEGFENRIFSKDFGTLLEEYSRKFPHRHVSAGDYLSRLKPELRSSSPGVYTEARSAIVRTFEELKKS